MDHLIFWRVLTGLLLCYPYDLLTSAAAILPSASKSCSSEKAMTITHIYSVPGDDSEQLPPVESDDNKLVFRHLLKLQSPAADCEKNALIDDLLARLMALELGMKEMKEQYDGCCGAVGKCNGKGKYVAALGYCQCDEGWEGPDCNKVKCPVDCGEFGKCVDGACVCAEGYTGVDCQEKKCDVDCRPNGRCVNGQCVCDEGFMGTDCSIEIASLCSYKGRYDPVLGTCVCDDGWEGPDCSQKSCPNKCANNGVCVNGVCQCAVGFTGPDCREKLCLPPCGRNGRCVNGVCQCTRGFTGPTCSEKQCVPGCGDNGKCVNGVCQCTRGFTGPTCSEKLCIPGCGDNGKCVNGVCECAVGFTGPTCSEKDCIPDCGDNGKCVNGVCQCNIGYTGPTCREVDCAISCGENGRCDGGQCFCEEGFFGESCSEVMAVQNLRLISTTEDSLSIAWDLLVEVDYYYISYYPYGDESQKRQIKVSANQDFYQIGGLNPSTLYKILMYQVKNGVTSDPAEIEGQTGKAHICVEVSGGSISPLQKLTERKVQHRQYKNGGDLLDTHQIPVWSMRSARFRSGPERWRGQSQHGAALGTLWVTEETEDSLEVEWENPDIRADYFKLRYAAQPGGAETEVQVSQSNDAKTGYIIKGLQPSTTYDISVQSVRKGREGKTSSVVGITGIDGPKNLVATDMGEDTASLSWDAAQAQIDRYILTYSSLDGHREEMAVGKDKTNTFLTGLTPGMEYIFNIWAEKGNKKSKRATVTALTDIDAPKNLEASEITQSEATLTWTPPVAQIDGYILSYEDTNGNRQEIELDAASKSYELKALNKGIGYNVFLRAYKGDRMSRQATTMFYTVTLTITSPLDCAQVRLGGNKESGVYTVYPGGENTPGVRVYCDQDTDGGGWTVFQRRFNGKLDFYQRWRTYSEGFGDPNDEFWLGLEWLNKLTTAVPYELRVDLKAGDESAYAVYSTFSVGTSRERYKLLVDGYSGTAGDALVYHNGLKFTTWDKDNDLALTNCALSHRGAFWYRNCHLANPNGQYGDNNHSQGVNWEPWKGHEFSIPSVEMKMRPKNLSA